MRTAIIIAATLALLALVPAHTTLAQTTAQQQPPPQASPPPKSDANALALQIMAAWQNSGRAPSLKEKIQLIETALSLAIPANPWPFREPARDQLLGQMWGQLGNEYRRIEGADRPAALERALKAYTEALRHVPRERASDWARIQYGLGSVFVDRTSGERAANLESAITAFQMVAQVMTRDSHPSLWGSVQISLSKAHWHRIQGTRADNLEQALAHAQAALSVFTKEKEPGDWASAQQALGAALWGRIRGSRADNIEKALAAYQGSLAVLTPERHAKAWAGTHDNIGMAMAERLRGDRRANIQAAAAAFEKAATIFTREAYPADWAQLQMNFGNLLLDSELDRPAENAERAIGRFRDALTVYTPQRYPERHARVLLNAGIALMRRSGGEPAQNIEDAIAAYRGALGHYTPENDPLKWSSLQANLAEALRRRVRADRAANLEAAASAINAALGVQTLNAFPQLHLRSANHAGVIAAARGDWQQAGAFFQRAIDASVRLFGQGLSPADAKLVLEEGGRLFSNAAYAAVRRNAPTEALDLLEAGKAQLLRVALGLDALALPREERIRLDQQRAEIIEIEAGIERTTGPERLALVQRLETLRESIVRQISHATAIETDAVTRLSGRVLAERLLASYAAIALPIVTEHGGSLLVVTGGERGSVVEATAVAGLDTATLDRLILGAEPYKGRGGWHAAYSIHWLDAAQQNARWSEWLQAVSDLGPALDRLIGAPLSRALQERRIADGAAVLWLPHGGLGLLPLGLALPEGSTTAILDRYALTVAPSLTAAEVARRRAQAKRSAPTLAAVVNPTGDLRFTEIEGAAARSYFPAAANVLGSDTATQPAVLQALPKASHWHFATHGRFSWAAPRDSALLLANSEQLTVGKLLDSPALGQPRLVILSACETGAFDFQRTPDEFTGLPSAFLQAGAAGVIATLWPVDDVSTALVVMQFYDRHLRNDQPPAVALRAAQIWLRDATRDDITAFFADMVRAGRVTAADEARLTAALAQASGDKPFAHPYHWAALQHYGH